MRTLQLSLRRQVVLMSAAATWLGCSGVAGGDVDPVRVGAYDTAGSAGGVAVSGRYAYVADGTNGLQIIDIANPAEPRRVGGYAGSRSANAVAVTGNLACVADGTNGLEVVDVSEPNNPWRVGGCEVTGHAWDVAVTGGHACVADELGLEVIDISKPSSPQRVGRYDAEGSVEAVAASGHYAYAVAWTWEMQGLQVIDVSNPAEPQRVGEYRADCLPYRVAVSGGHVYLAGGVQDEVTWLYRDGLLVIDISNPVSPHRVGGFDTVGFAADVAVLGDRAYVLDSAVGLEVIDVADPANPRRVGRHAPNRWTGAVAVSGNHACVVGGDPNFQVIDISRPANPQRLGGFPTRGPVTDVAVSGSNAYVAESWWTDGTNWNPGSLHVIDISQPAEPQRLGGYETNEGLWSVAVSGDYAYVTTDYRPSSLLVLNVSNPVGLQCVGEVTNFDGGVTVVSGNRAYVAAGSLHIVDVSDPAHPQRLGNYRSAGNIVDVAVSDHYAYIAESAWREGTNLHLGGLRVIDVANPANPQRVGGCDTSQSAEGVALSGQYACVAAGEAGLVLIDVSAPTNPQQVGDYDTPGSFYSVAVSGHHAYVVDWGIGLHVIDISDPANPRRVAGNSVYEPTRVAVRDAQVFLTTEKHGLVIAEMVPFFTSISHEGQELKLSWEGFGPARLLHSTSLMNPDWQELSGYEATNAATLPISAGPEFFRLVKP